MRPEENRTLPSEDRERTQRMIFRYFNLAANVLILLSGTVLLVMGRVYATPWSTRFGTLLGGLLIAYGLVRLLLYWRTRR